MTIFQKIWTEFFGNNRLNKWHKTAFWLFAVGVMLLLLLIFSTSADRLFPLTVFEGGILLLAFALIFALNVVLHLIGYIKATDKFNKSATVAGMVLNVGVILIFLFVFLLITATQPVFMP